MNNNILKNKKTINAGGINGTGKGIVNTNSKEFKALRSDILEHSKKQSESEKINYELISIKYQMESYVAEKKPKENLTSGFFLKKHLLAIGIKNKVFAKYLNIEQSNLSAIINDKRKITTELAFKVGQLFNVNPSLWLQIKNKNELSKLQHTKIKKKFKLSELLKAAI